MKRKSRPQISVITPIYNREKEIINCIKSVKDQTFKNFEHIIIDDGSTDNSLKVIIKLSKKYKKIRILKNSKNEGISFCRNLGIKKASGKYIVWQDSDDIASENRLEELFNFMEKNKNIAICGSFIEYFGFNKGIRKYPLSNNEIIKKVFRYTPIAQPSAIVRKKLYKKVGLFNQKLKTAEDLDMLFRFLRFYKGANIDKVLLKYNYSNSSITYKNLKDTLKITYKIKYKNLKYFKASFIDKIYLKVLKFSTYIPNNFVIEIFQKFKNYI